MNAKFALAVVDQRCQPEGGALVENGLRIAAGGD
jgi:hypothetical protein